MGRTRRNAKPPGQQVPGNRANQSGKNYFKRNKILVDGIGNGIADLEFPDQVFGNKKGGKIEQRGPQYSLKGCEYLGGNDGGNGIGGIVKAIDIIENQREDDDNYQERHWKLGICG
jgi:hypothetical protein